MKSVKLSYGYACLVLVFLCGLVLWIHRDNLPGNIPMFQTLRGGILLTCPKSPLTIARLPLMHLDFLLLILGAAKACPSGSDWSRIVRIAILTATLKALFEILALAYGISVLGIAAAGVVLLFLIVLIHFLWQRNWSFKFETLPLTMAVRGWIGLGLLVYVLLTAMPFWLPSR
jgi:hypothetical protein